MPRTLSDATPYRPIPTAYTWRWRRTQYGPLADGLAERFGEPCLIFARGLNGSVGVEFGDGWRVVAPRFAVGPRPSTAP